MCRFLIGKNTGSFHCLLHFLSKKNLLKWTTWQSFCFLKVSSNIFFLSVAKKSVSYHVIFQTVQAGQHMTSKPRGNPLTNWWVSSTPFGVLFHLPLQFYIRGSSLFIICKWLVQMDINNISASFQKLFVAVLTWKRMYLLHLSLLLYWNEMSVYQFNCHLSYLFRYQFSCF